MQLIEFLSPTDLEAIHQTSMDILAKIGICFPHPQAVKVFQKHGFKTEDQQVYLEEKQIMELIGHVPSQFTIQARNPNRSVTVGNGLPVFAPGYGAPFLIDPKQGKQIPTIEDYQNLVRLAHSLPNQDLSGYLLVEPHDIHPGMAQLYMLQANIRYSDKPFLGSTEGAVGAAYTLDLLKILHGDTTDKHYTLGVINPLSPLRYSTDMLEALMVYAQGNQPLTFATLIMAGSTGPITLPGVIALQNAELLAGIALAQLIKPGLPILYGSSSTNIDMKTGGLAVGSPELSLCIAAHAQLARRYNLPSRAGGALTDASVLDAQAGYESMFSLLTAINSGIDFILHSAGIMCSYLAFSYEKFVMDDELCGMVKHYRRGLDVTEESLAFESIQQNGDKGHFLQNSLTRERCRTEFWLPNISDRSGLEAWWGGDRLDTTARSRLRWQTLLDEYQEPKLDQLIDQQIQDYISDQE
jgi:trimethylamine--corrinoid protein Co-methyltransferase